MASALSLLPLLHPLLLFGVFPFSVCRTLHAASSQQTFSKWARVNGSHLILTKSVAFFGFQQQLREALSSVCSSLCSWEGFKERRESPRVSVCHVHVPVRSHFYLTARVSVCAGWLVCFLCPLCAHFLHWFLKIREERRRASALAFVCFKVLLLLSLQALLALPLGFLRSPSLSLSWFA